MHETENFMWMSNANSTLQRSTSKKSPHIAPFNACLYIQNNIYLSSKMIKKFDEK